MYRKSCPISQEMDKESNEIMEKYNQKEEKWLKTLKDPYLPNIFIDPQQPRLIMVRFR